MQTFIKLKISFFILILLIIFLSSCATNKSPHINQTDPNNFQLAVPQNNSNNNFNNNKNNNSVNIIKLSPTDTASSDIKTEGMTAIATANQKATQQPNSDNYLNAMMYFNYQPGALYQIYAALLNITDLQFQPGEQIISFAAGDTLRWQIVKTSSGSGEDSIAHLIIKPTEANIATTVIVTTDRRTYLLQLHATDRIYMAAVTWRYSDDNNNLLQNFNNTNNINNTNNFNIDLNSLNFNYKIKYLGFRKPDWLPLKVFNDGHKTYIEFSDLSQNAPILLVNTDQSGVNQNNKIVNYRVIGNYYIVDTVINSAQLRLGGSPERNAAIVTITAF